MNHKQRTQINKMKLNQILTPEQLDDFEKHGEAALILQMLSEKASLGHHINLLKRLYFYLDLDFVKKALIEIYRTADSAALKEAIIELHDGTFDINDYLSYLERRDAIEAYAQKIEDEDALEMEKEN
jgi:hypothetical protein